MIEWDVTDTGVRATDPVDNEVFVRAPDWRPANDDRAFDRPVDERTAGVTAGLSVPPGYIRVTNVDTGDAVTLGEGERHQFGDGDYVLDVSADIKIAVRFDGPATVRRRADGTSVVFEAPTRVALGFRCLVQAPAETVTVPRTLDGVATAISHASAAHRTMTSDRTFRSLRRHPPQFAVGDELDVPEQVADRTPDTGVELVVPESLESLFLTAPVAFFLGADVRVEAGATPRLSAPDAGLDYEFGSLVADAPATFERLFWMECLARNGGPHAPSDLQEHDLLTDVGVDHETAYEASVAERAAMYLDAPYERIADAFPEWPLGMHVAPDYDHVSVLPFMLDRLAFVYPPETAELPAEELMERSLDDFYRGTAGPVATVEMLKPRLRRGRVQGWLADGAPIDVFKTLPEAYQNHVDYLGPPDDDEISVAVVLNDRGMTSERDAVAEIYTSRAEDLPMSVSFHKNLTRDELAALFVEHHEFVHYIGHCEVDGLRCADGNLSTASLPETNVETFFLNACGSYYEGLELVRKGSVAGAVTFRKVLDEQAATVGTTFARLLVHGFPITTALRLARRRIMMGKDYAVVGAGVQTLSQTESGQSCVAYLDPLESGEFDVRWTQLGFDHHGGYYMLNRNDPDPPRLAGNDAEFTATADELVELFEGANYPVVVDGDFYWTDEAVDYLRSGNTRSSRVRDDG